MGQKDQSQDQLELWGTTPRTGEPVIPMQSPIFSYTKVLHCGNIRPTSFKQKTGVFTLQSLRLMVISVLP